jgi:DNA-binding MarR family transcriptional regulator
MSVRKLSLLIEKLIHMVHTEETEYIKNSELHKLTSTQIHYLDLIHRAGNPTLSELARKLKVTKPTVTNTIEKLETRGYLYKVQSDDDRRIQHLHLTQKGNEIAVLHNQFHRVFTGKLVRDLDQDEIDQLVSVLEKVLS